MKINLKKLVPKEWTIENVNKDKIKVYYINKGRGNSPKPMILPKIINVDKEFIGAIAMYLGDGKLSDDDKHLEFSSIDDDMVNFMLNFFMNRFDIPLRDMTISIRCKELMENTIKRWSQVLNIHFSKFKIRFSVRHRNESCAVQINSKIFRIIFGNIINEIKSSNFLSREFMRRAFLRGLFAAEGNIAIDYKENYIVCMQYCLHIDEEDIASLIKKALSIEDMTYREHKNESNNSLVVRFTSWKNYIKFWKINSFDLTQRKKKQFLDKVKRTRFFFKIESAMIEQLLNSSGYSHRQIALKLGIHPATLCYLNKKKTDYINIFDLISLSKFNNIPLEKIKRNIITTRVNRVTPINDPEFVDFIFDLKSYS